MDLRIVLHQSSRIIKSEPARAPRATKRRITVWNDWRGLKAAKSLTLRAILIALMPLSMRVDNYVGSRVIPHPQSLVVMQGALRHQQPILRIIVG